ncbi:hypothetical protein AVEN_259316-1 [Araneus ventricosus]|uniref:Uncharacterized protein n=1 Tax=Araneus ventricosus TaxID=182803 RepID=A0A4Y2GHK0_ARAVE|nr:hypothetical protein AVEN_259316-1 [Araneus ventricosus]
MMKREEDYRFVVGEAVHHPDKSWKLNLSATLQRAGSKVFLSWNSDDGRGDSRRVDWRLGFDSRDRILKSGLSPRLWTCSGV